MRYATTFCQTRCSNFFQLVDKLQSKEHSNQKRKKKLISAFKDMMKGVKEITTTSTWVDVCFLFIFLLENAFSLTVYDRLDHYC